MSFRDCLLSAVQQGAISREEADRLQAAFDEEFQAARRTLGDDAASAAAREKLAKDLDADALEKKRHVLLAQAAQDRIAEYVAGYRDLKGNPDAFGAALNLIEHYGYSNGGGSQGTENLAGKYKAIVSLIHGEAAGLLMSVRKTRLSGQRMNKPLADDVVRAILDGDKTKPEATAFGDIVQKINEDLRQRFNAAGGAIGKIEGGYLPQFHDPRALLNAGREAWKDFTRPLLDAARMKDPLTGGALTPARLDDLLDRAFDAVTTDGWIKREPEMRPFGKGALAGQRAEERVLMFKNADAWLSYNANFGKGDPVKAIFQHWNGMARDIAALETFGPNPGATIEWLKQIVQTEGAKAIAGKPSLYPNADRTSLQYAPWRIDSVYQYVRGRRTVNEQLAAGFGSVRNVITSAVLGSASVLAASTDPVIDMAARYMSGLPMTKALWGLVSTFKGAVKEDVVRSGILVDDFLHIMGDEARYVGVTAAAPEWSRWLAERTMNWSGLEPMTQARRHVFARDFEAHLADHADIPFEELPAYTRRAMTGYGLDAAAWDAMRAVPAFKPEAGSAGFLRPIDIANSGEGANRAVAERYLQMILGETERAVPTGTARARAMISAGQPRGTWVSEILESGLQFKSFALSFTALQVQAVMQEVHAGGVPRGAAYAGALAIGLTLGGGLALQLKNIVNGKDPQPMDDPRFWLAALQTGGGVGLLGDFLFADVNRMGHNLGEQLAGPTVGLVTDLSKLTVGNVREAVQGKDTHIGREVVNFLGRYTPVASSLWPTRAAYRRIFLDQLQYLADPDASKAFRAQESKLRSETRQGFFWPPGDVLPARAPQLPR